MVQKPTQMFDPVHQEAGIIRPSQPDRGLVAVPVRDLGEVILAKIASQAIHKRNQARRLRHGVHDRESARRRSLDGLS